MSSPDAASTLVIDITNAGGWNFSGGPPAGAECSAPPEGTTPVQITCVFTAPFTGPVSLLLLGTGGTKGFTASVTAADNTDPTPDDATVSYSAP